MTTREYLTKTFRKKSVVTLDEIYFEAGLDRENQTDQKQVSKVIRQHCRLRDNHFVPSHFSIRRGKDVICELLQTEPEPPAPIELKHTITIEDLEKRYKNRSQDFRHRNFTNLDVQFELDVSRSVANFLLPIPTNFALFTKVVIENL